MTGHGLRDVENRVFLGEEIGLRTFGNGQYRGRFILKPKPGREAVAAGAWSQSRWLIRPGVLQRQGDAASRR